MNMMKKHLSKQEFYIVAGLRARTCIYNGLIRPTYHQLYIHVHVRYNGRCTHIVKCLIYIPKYM